jgi:carbonic anhydrase/acetyltransferase-like protein (isoleucine patch superfamily)
MIKNFAGKRPDIAASAFISETALIMGDVEIGEDSGIWPGAIIRGDFAHIRIGERTIIEDNVVVHTGTDMDIGDNVIVGHGAVIHGKSIGNNSLIANNATILDDSIIGNFCIIGAGCVVSPGMKIPDRSLVFGIPGKVAGQVKDHQIKRLEAGNESYRAMFAQYRADGI